MTPVTVAVEKGQLAFFAKAIGEDNPIYCDEDAAKNAGYRGIVAPPTYTFSLNNLSRRDPFAYMPEIGMDISNVLHAEEKFEYFGDICAGDVLTMQEEIVDIYDKKGGALQFFVTEMPVINQDGKVVVKATNVLAIRNNLGGK